MAAAAVGPASPVIPGLLSASDPLPQPKWRELLGKVEEKNNEGMSSLRSGEAKDALDTLQEAQTLLGGEDPDAPGAPLASATSEEERRAIAKVCADTASNLGICHKRVGARAQAVRNLQKALQLYRVAQVDLRTQIAAHLNLSACLSDASVHDEALQQATAAVELGGRLVAGSELNELSPQYGGDSPSQLQPRADDYAMLAVAYHKVAEANEGLRDWQAACFAYAQAYEIVRRSLGPDHRLTRSFEKSSRCPRRAKTPNVPGDWLAGKPTPRRLPEVPRKVGGRLRTELVSMGNYHLDSASFPKWPPENASKEERQWYLAAQRHHSRLRSKEISVIGQARDGAQATAARTRVNTGGGPARLPAAAADTPHFGRPATF